jgi:ParB family chromosome partitioning protein
MTPAQLLETPAPSTVPDVRMIALEQLHESPLNSRQRFDEHKLQELADSLPDDRPAHARARAAVEAREEAGLRTRRGPSPAPRGRASRVSTHMMAIVRELTDREFLEILTIENLQREDVHPLDEAHGYQELMKSGNYDVAKIADRIGKSSHSYVRDRLKLLQLIDRPRRSSFSTDRSRRARGDPRAPVEGRPEARDRRRG